MYHFWGKSQYMITKVKNMVRKPKYCRVHILDPVPESNQFFSNPHTPSPFPSKSNINFWTFLFSALTNTMCTTKCGAITLNKLCSYYYTVFLNINKENGSGSLWQALFQFMRALSTTLVKTGSSDTNAIVHQHDTFSLCPPPARSNQHCLRERGTVNTSS